MAEPKYEIRYRFESAREPRRPRIGPLPRITRLMALAIHFEHHFGRSELDRHTLARLGSVSRTRVTQILNLLNLAPDIQEHLLRLAPLRSGREPVTETSLRRLAGEVDWQRQCETFDVLLRRRMDQQQRGTARR